MPDVFFFQKFGFVFLSLGFPLSLSVFLKILKNILILRILQAALIFSAPVQAERGKLMKEMRIIAELKFTNFHSDYKLELRTKTLGESGLF